MTRVRGYDELKKLGEGGQSEVFLVRRTERVRQRFALSKEMMGAIPAALRAASGSAELRPFVEPASGAAGRDVLTIESMGKFAELAYEYARPEHVSELGALKLFKIPTGTAEAEEALGRLRNEIAVLQKGKPGLVKLVEADEKEGWMVTEFMPGGTLESNPSKYKGNALGALRAFRSLAETVASLHKENIVHRDIKPANVFLSEPDQLTLGDFGIVYLPDQAERVTVTDERVGPRDYMPQWGDLGGRLENVHTNFDVYMLGKLLWCIVSGRLKLPREYHKKPAYDVAALFPNEPDMRAINEILEKCVVEEPQNCLKSAQELLGIVDENIAVLERGLPMTDRSGKLALPCRVCGRGVYQEYTTGGSHVIVQVLDSMSRPNKFNPSATFRLQRLYSL